MLTEILLFSLVSILIFWYFLCECVRPKGFPAGPAWTPLIGNGPELRKLATKLGGQHHAYQELARQYATDVLGLKLGNERAICVCSYETIQQILTSDVYLGRPDNFFLRLRCMGTRKGITVADGLLWKEQRSFLVYHFKSLGFGKGTMEQMVKEQVKDFLQLMGQNNGAEISSTLAMSVLHILWNLTSGSGFKGRKRIQTLLILLNKRSKAFDMSGGMLNNYPWLRYLAPDKTGYNLIRKINQEIRELITEVINEHRENWSEGRNDDFIYAFLSQMMKVKGEGYFDEEQLMLVCLDILIAGSITTSSTLDFAFLSMILYPDVQDKVHECLELNFNKHDEVFYCDRLKVQYVEAVLLEIQRFFTVVPVTGPRRALAKTELKQYLIPKNTTVYINVHSVHHDRRFWNDPEVFRPERFLSSDGRIVNQDRILTFGIGKRKCLGDVLARSCIFLFFVETLRKYRIESDGEPPTGKQIPGITVSPEKYGAKFIPR